MIPCEALDVAQIQKAQTKPPVALIFGQPDQPTDDLDVFGCVALTRPRDPNNGTNEGDRDEVNRPDALSRLKA